MDDDLSPDVTEAVEVSDLREKSAAVRDPQRSLLTPRQRMQRLAVAGASVVLALLILATAVPDLREGAGSWLADIVPPRPSRYRRAPIASASSRAFPISSFR